MKKEWEIKKLGDVCEMYQPKTISTKEMVQNGRYLVFGANGIIGKYDKYNHEESQLLITCRGATCGSVNISEPRSWINGNAMVIKPKDKSIDFKFLEYLFRGGINLSSIITGAAQPQITRQSLIPVIITYPKSLSEQKQIVSILDKSFSEIEKAKSIAEQNLKNAKEVFDNTLKMLFINKDNSWVTSTIGETCSLMTGGTPNTSRKEYYNNGDIKWLVSGDINKKEIFDCEGRITKLGLENSNAKCLPINSVLIALNGQGKTRGTVAMLRTEATCNQSLVSIYPNNIREILPELIYANLDGRYDEIRKITGDSGNDRRGLNMPIIRNISFSYPKSIKEQQLIIKKLELLRLEINKLDSIYQKKTLILEELKKSILQKAFSGELTSKTNSDKTKNNNIKSLKEEVKHNIPSPFFRNQVHFAILEQVVKDGGDTTEVAVVKYDYLLQEVFGVPLMYNFTQNTFGPFDYNAKRLIKSALSPKNNWFRRSGKNIVFGNNSNKLINKNNQSGLYEEAKSAMDKLAKWKITEMKAFDLELLATVCFSIKLIKSTEFKDVKGVMDKWKTNNNMTKGQKFSVEKIKRCIDFILKNKLEKTLLISS